MWVKFTADFDWTPKAERRVTIAFKAGMVRSVTKDCGDTAIAGGKAIVTTPPPKEERA